MRDESESKIFMTTVTVTKSSSAQICTKFVKPLHIFSKNKFYSNFKNASIFNKKHHYLSLWLRNEYLLLDFVDLINSLSVITYLLKSPQLISKLTLVQICALNSDAQKVSLIGPSISHFTKTSFNKIITNWYSHYCFHNFKKIW